LVEDEERRMTVDALQQRKVEVPAIPRGSQGGKMAKWMEISLASG